MSTGRDDAAEKWLRQALALRPQSAAVMFKLGTLLHDKGDVRTAERLYMEALRIDPTVSAACHFAAPPLDDNPCVSGFCVFVWYFWACR